MGSRVHTIKVYWWVHVAQGRRHRVGGGGGGGVKNRILFDGNALAITSKGFL